MDAKRGVSYAPHLIHITTILHHFAPLSTTCMFIIVQKIGKYKGFFTISLKFRDKKIGQLPDFWQLPYMLDIPNFGY
jgi:hypothetical protein